MFPKWYCWWLKSETTTWDVWNPINNGKCYLSTGAGFQPSTVCIELLGWCSWWWNFFNSEGSVVTKCILYNLRINMALGCHERQPFLLAQFLPLRIPTCSTSNRIFHQNDTSSKRTPKISSNPVFVSSICFQPQKKKLLGNESHFLNHRPGKRKKPIDQRRCDLILVKGARLPKKKQKKRGNTCHLADYTKPTFYQNQKPPLN